MRGALDRLGAGVVEDDVGALAAELQGQLLQVAGGGRRDDQLAHRGGTGERHLVHVHMSGQGRSGGLAEAGYHVHDAGRHASLGDEPGQPQRGQRGLLGRLEHHAVARGQRRAQFPRGHQQREVPRDDLPDDAERLAQRVGVEVRPRHVGHREVDRVALELGRPTGHVVEQVRGQRHVRRLRHADRLAVVQRLELGQLVGVLEDQVADPPDDPAALRRAHPAPRALVERAARGPHSPVDVLGIALGDPGERLPGRGVGGLERLARRRVAPLPVDEQLSRGADEGFDVAIQGHGHVMVISLGCVVEATARWRASQHLRKCLHSRPTK